MANAAKFLVRRGGIEGPGFEGYYAGEAIAADDVGDFKYWIVGQHFWCRYSRFTNVEFLPSTSDREQRNQAAVKIVYALRKALAMIVQR